MPRFTRQGLTVSILAVMLAASAIGLVSAAIPNSTTKVYVACMSSSGALRLIDHQAGKRCKGTEKTVQWNQKGATGAAGAPGTPGADGVSGYEVVSEDHVFTVSEQFGTAVTECSSGKVPLGGGYRFKVLNDHGYGSVIGEYPTETGWAVDWYHGNQTIPIEFSVYAICASVR